MAEGAAVRDTTPAQRPVQRRATTRRVRSDRQCARTVRASHAGMLATTRLMHREQGGRLARRRRKLHSPKSARAHPGRLIACCRRVLTAAAGGRAALRPHPGCAAGRWLPGRPMLTGAEVARLNRYVTDMYSICFHNLSLQGRCGALR